MDSALSSNFSLIGFTVLEIVRFSYFGILAFGISAWNCLFTPTFREFWGHIFPIDVIYLSNPQKVLPCAETRRLSHKTWKSVNRFDLGAGSRKKTRQDMTGQSKSHKGVIFYLFGEKPALIRFSQKCTVVAVPDIITCAKFGNEIFRCYGFTGGRISHFPVDYCMSLTTVQRYSALPVKLLYTCAHWSSTHETR